MTDRLQPAGDSELGSASRPHRTEDAGSAGFEPLDGAAIAARAARRGQPIVWGLVAAVVLLLIVGVAIATRPRDGNPIIATPAPVPSPAPSTTEPAAWYSWVRVADSPFTEVGASVGTDGESHYFTMAEGSCTRLLGHRHDAAGDRWSSLPDHEVPSWWCGGSLQAHAHGDDIYVAAGDHSGDCSKPPRDGSLSVYRTATQRWEDLPSPERCYDIIVAVADGLAYLGVELGGEPDHRLVVYSFFDYETGRWRYQETPEDSPPTLFDAMADEWRVGAVEFDGRSLIMFRSLRAGGFSVALLDPVTNTIVSGASVPLPAEVGELDDVDDYQVTDSGWLYVGPDLPRTEGVVDGTQGVLIDLRTGSWHTIDLPPMAELADDQQGAQSWAREVYDEAARYVAIRGRLYDPADDRWLAFDALPRIEPPVLDPPDAEGFPWWDPARDRTMCEYPGPGACWQLVVPPFTEVTREVR